VPKRSDCVYRNKAAQVTAGLAIALCAGTGLAISLDPKAPPYLGGLIGVFGGYLAWMFGWQSSVRLRADGVVVANMFITGFVPWASFREFRIANGLKVVMTDGHMIGSLAFGGSVAGQLSGYRRLRRIAGQMEECRQELAANDGALSQLSVSVDAEVSHGRHSAYRKGVRFELWPALALLVPLELLGLLTSTLG
jgi:hypothetical protein